MTLQELRDRMRAATGPKDVWELTRPLVNAFLEAAGRERDEDITTFVLDAFGPGRGSIDAALALVPAGWRVSKIEQQCEGGAWTVVLYSRDRDPIRFRTASGSGRSMALAIVDARLSLEIEAAREVGLSSDLQEANR